MMHQDSLEPAAIQFTFERLQAIRIFSPCFFHVSISTGTLILHLGIDQFSNGTKS